MKRLSFPLCCIRFASCARIVQTASNPLSSAVRQSHENVNKNWLAAAGRVLEKDYSFRPATFDSLTDANASNIVKLPYGQKTKLGALAGIVSRDTEPYAILNVSMRPSGVLPCFE